MWLIMYLIPWRWDFKLPVSSSSRRRVNQYIRLSLLLSNVRLSHLSYSPRIICIGCYDCSGSSLFKSFQFRFLVRSFPFYKREPSGISEFMFVILSWKNKPKSDLDSYHSRETQRRLGSWTKSSVTWLGRRRFSHLNKWINSRRRCNYTFIYLWKTKV